MLSLLLLLFVLWMVYKLWISPMNYWEKRGFVAIPGKFPFGSSKAFSLMRGYQGTIMKEMYERSAPAPYFGIYVMRNPILVLRDPEVIKLVLTKEFSHFQNRIWFDRAKKEILEQHLFNLDGERWKGIRMKLTPTFTSGKLKAMFPQFVSCAEDFDEMVLSRMESMMNAKEAVSSFSIDTICSCAFGLAMNGLSNLDSKILEVGNESFEVHLQKKIKNALLNFIPEINHFYKPRFLPKIVDEFFLKMMRETFEYRQKSGMKRNDFVDLLMDLKNKGNTGDGLSDKGTTYSGQTVEITDELMAAQCFLFFAAGFEDSSSVLSYAIYELALHQDIQQQLQKEIDDKLQEHGGLTYRAIQEMTYLDMVVSETMRKHPNLPLLTRQCTKDFTFPSGHKVERGTGIVIPVYALHHDPEYYPDPDRFDPERFSTKNQTTIRPYTYLPFGKGPRICIGMRFGLLQTKMGLITLFRKYSVLPTSETKIPLSFVGSLVVATLAEPIYVKLISRSS